MSAERFVDVLFYNAASSARRGFIFHTVLGLLQAAIWTFLISKWLKTPDEQSPMSLYLTIMVLLWLSVLCHLYKLIISYNLQTTLNIADTVMHSTTRNVEHLEDGLEGRVMDVYSFGDERQLTELEKIAQQGLLQNVISLAYAKKTSMVGSLLKLLRLVRSILLIDLLVKLLKSQIYYHTLPVAIFAVFEWLMLCDVMCVYIVILLSPLFCALLCCLIYTISSNQANTASGSAPVSLNVIQFGPTVRLGGNTDCRICFQTFNFGDKIIQLPCHQSHCYHEFCLKSWLRISRTCPMCRVTVQ